MPDTNGNVTVAVYDPAGPNDADLLLKLSQDGGNVHLSAVDADGTEKSFGLLMVFEGQHGGHVEPKTRLIADNLGLERDNEHMKITR
jgi:hypothetical protein